MLPTITESTRTFDVSVGHESGTFFAREWEPRLRGESVHYGATWCCVSTYGVFGCSWSHMGCPFPQFAAKIGPDYLLGKISTRETDPEETVANLRREILSIRREHDLSAEAAREAWNTIDDLVANYAGGEALVTHLCEASELAVAGLEVCELVAYSHPADARKFVEKLWPEFVKELAAPAL